MSKNLIALISTDGKTPEEISNEMFQAVVKYEAISMGLHQCPKCGEYVGDIVDDGEEIEVDCICNGSICHRCNKNIIHRPMSNYFDPISRHILHSSYLSGMAGCAECRALGNKLR